VGSNPTSSAKYFDRARYYSLTLQRFRISKSKSGYLQAENVPQVREGLKETEEMLQGRIRLGIGGNAEQFEQVAAISI
jgi:hypothetical protein